MNGLELTAGDLVNKFVAVASQGVNIAVSKSQLGETEAVLTITIPE
jgi:hypothetical protein